MTYYAVIDTNVIVSSLLKQTSVPGMVVSKAFNGPIIPLLNEEILKEYRDVLTRNKFGFEESDVEKLIGDLSKHAIFLDGTTTEEEIIDLNDVVFYEIVMTARNSTEAYLVTGNKKHFPVKSYVVTPREMLDIIEQK